MNESPDGARAASSFRLKAFDGTELAVHAFPAAGAGPVTMVLHGIVSHAGWYRSLGEDLAERGVSVYLMDRRGSGRSAGAPGHANSWRHLVHDVAHLALELKRRHGTVPLQAIGISLGSVVSLAASILFPRLFETQLLLSPGLASTVRIPLRRRLELLTKSFVRPKALLDLPFSVAELTDQEAWRAVYEADELRTRRVTARFLVQTVFLQRFVLTRLHRLDVPVYALLAGNDTIVDNEVAIKGLARTASAARIEIFEDAAHNLVAALPRNALLDRLESWSTGGFRTADRGLRLVRTRLDTL